MKREDLYNAITDLKDDQILAGEAPLKQKTQFKRSRWLVGLAAALALIVGAAAILPGVLAPKPKDEHLSTNVSPNTPNDPISGTNVLADHPALKLCNLSAAQYPSDLPALTDFVTREELRQDPNLYAGALQKQQEALRASLPAEAPGAEMTSFLNATIPQILSCEDGENRIYSPLSLYLALSMLSETVEGEGRSELLALLGQKDLDTLRAQCASLWLTNYADNELVTSILGNSLWLRKGTNYNTDTLERLARYYYADSFSGEMGSEDYDRAIAEWIDARTGNLLHDQASALKTDPSTVLRLLSTIYLKANWQSPFDEEITDTFHSPQGDKEVTFLTELTEDATLYSAPGFSAVGKTLMGEGQMLFLLPDEGVRAEDLLQSPEALAFLSSQAGREAADKRSGPLALSVPQFDVSSELDLIDNMQKLGVQTIFRAGAADFSPIAPENEDLSVSRIEQDARVKIDRYGCEAAAFTVVDMTEGFLDPNGLVNFTLDRPFVFAITNAAGLPLFVGVVNQP